eukprot:scaffold15598_cov144-Skeletonema_dohrnii-CCMP3373.AAC.3
MAPPTKTIRNSSIGHGNDGPCSLPDQLSSCLSINYLPDSILRFIGEYLRKSSRAIMASALSRSACFESDTLDFSDTGRDLAPKLTDSDISNILVSIDAVNALKVLKLIGCENITGTGLDPLRGSAVLEQIDLSSSDNATIANGEDLFSPNFPWCFTLSEDAVIPILDSIIAEKDRALNHVQLPLVWRKKKSKQLVEFLESYNLVKSSRLCLCVQCDDVVESSVWMNQIIDSSDWGLQSHTCYDCTEHICQECEAGFCQDCRKQFCEDCCTTKICEMCYSAFCSECEDLAVCEVCDNYFCQDCMPVRFCDCCNRDRCVDCMLHWDCSRCGKSNCDDCADEHNVQWCEVCEDEYCNDCRLEDYNNGELDCKGCRGLLLPRIMHEKEALSRENEMLKFVVINALNEISKDPSKAMCIECTDKYVQEDDCIITVAV